MGRDSSVGVESRYGLDGLGIESLCGRDFPYPSRTSLGSSASNTMCTGSFPGVKRPARDVDHPPPSNTEVKERAELNYSPPGLLGLF